MDPLEELLFWEEQRERQQRLDAIWPAFRRVTPRSMQKAILYGRELNQTERIYWAGCKKKIREIVSLFFVQIMKIISVPKFVIHELQKLLRDIKI